MRLNYIESRNPIAIYTEENRDVEIQAKFIDNLDDAVFYIYNQEMYENINSLIDKIITVIIIINDKPYKAEARVLGEGGKKRSYDNTIMLEIVSGFKQETRRTSVRYDIRVKTKIYEYSESQNNSYKGDFICDAVSEDVSRGGMRLTSNHKLRIPKETLVVLDFSIKPKSTSPMYSIPSKIMRSYRNISSYEYSFQFDFIKMPEIQENLLSDIFDFKLSGARSIQYPSV